jgi:sugar transferase (PEP-CTERM/EpsH1 system associated)
MFEDHEARRIADARPLRLAFVVHTFDFGGVERCIARIVNGLDSTRTEPLIVCLNRNGDAAQWIARPHVPILEIGKRSGNDLKAVRRLARVLREQRVDIVHSHNWPTLVETMVARRWAGVPVHVHAEHGLIFDDRDASRWRSALRWRLARWALRRTDAVVAIARSVRDRLVSHAGLAPESIHWIPNGVDPQNTEGNRRQREALRASLGIGPGDWAVGSVGRLAPVKDFATAIEAVRRLAAQGIDVHLVLVGDGPSRESLAAEAARHGLQERVHLVGQQLDVSPWLAALDVYVNSSVSEAMNLGILEAMSAGLPCAVSDVGDNAWLVEGEEGCGRCGLVVPPSSPERLAEALGTLLADASLREDCGLWARRRFTERFSTGVMVRQYEDLYGLVLRNKVRQVPATA